eukprot:494664-Pyramimonas_sp.AAC.1
MPTRIPIIPPPPVGDVPHRSSKRTARIPHLRGGKSASGAQATPDHRGASLIIWRKKNAHETDENTGNGRPSDGQNDAQ